LLVSASSSKSFLPSPHLSSNYGPASSPPQPWGAFLILGKDVPSRFMVGELCGPLKDQGFQEGINPFLLPETNLVIEEVQVFSGVFVLVGGSSCR
jgi:hypothetical protein